MILFSFTKSHLSVWMKPSCCFTKVFIRIRGLTQIMTIYRTADNKIFDSLQNQRTIIIIMTIIQPPVFIESAIGLTRPILVDHLTANDP